MTSTLLLSRPVEARRAASALWSAFRLGAGQTLAAWPVLVGRCIFYVILLIVLSALWDKVVAERLPGTLAGELPPGGLALYIGVTEWITLALPAVHLKLEDDIRSGGLEPHLLRPKSYLAQTFSQSLGAAMVRLGALGLTALALLAISGREPPPLEAFAYIVPLGVLGVIVGILLYALAGLMAFWARRTLPFQLVIQKLMFLLGGLYAPVTLYPPVLEAVAKASPFAAHLYWPSIQAIATSRDGFLMGLAWQALWIAVLALACLRLWRAGLAKVLREGGV
ncbi:MAG: ABC-2 family transporter protein [Pseudomonadota bacterium]|uniref:ABC-2 family transporter protein n=1 Tax=Phenylobacterium sp. TaxID=1871053 RepID=UPI002723C486|nr:ABC-2 family transporter protein [Phenylobacterium sp.]MDO9432194.1 ABC-2 family transporter protein [Phenylobacterium sp.]